MRSLQSILLCGLAPLLLSACGDPEQPSEPEADSRSAGPDTTEPAAMPQQAAEAERADPVEVDPEHYSVELDNEAVRVLRIRYGPGEESVMHAHPPSVAVFLTDAEGEMTLPDGSTEQFYGSAGSVGYSEDIRHRPRNTSDAAWEIVEIELKERRSEPTEEGGTDPAEADAGHYTTEFENESVRVLRVTMGPGEESVMHYHPPNVAVFLSDTQGEMTLPDGSTEELSASAGDVVFDPGGQHLPATAPGSSSEVILVELK